MRVAKSKEKERHKMESHKPTYLMEGAYRVRFIKAQRMKWLGIIERVDQARPTRKPLDWKPMGTRPVGRPTQRCKRMLRKT